MLQKRKKIPPKIRRDKRKCTFDCAKIISTSGDEVEKLRARVQGSVGIIVTHLFYGKEFSAKEE